MDLADIRGFDLGVGYLLTIIDCFSKFAFALPIIHRTQKEVASWLDLIFSQKHPGYKPKLLLSDEGKEFNNNVVRNVCKKHKVFQIFSLPYHPLGMIERFNQTIKRKIRFEHNRYRLTKQNFEQMLIKIINEYNTSMHSTIKNKPIIIHFINDPNYANDILEKTKARFETIKEKQEKKHYLKKRQLFKPGDKVRVLVWKDPRNTPAENSTIKGKFKYKKFNHAYWTKEHFVIEAPKGINYRLKGYKQLFNPVDLQKVF